MQWKKWKWPYWWNSHRIGMWGRGIGNQLWPMPKSDISSIELPLRELSSELHYGITDSCFTCKMLSNCKQSVLVNFSQISSSRTETPKGKRVCNKLPTCTATHSWILYWTCRKNHCGQQSRIAKHCWK